MLLVDVTYNGPFTINIFSINGKLLSQYSGNSAGLNSVHFPVNNTDIAIVCVRGADWTESRIVYRQNQ
jgi:hypothetical protein